MFCPTCGRKLTGPTSPNVPFPMFICSVDGVVYDQKRAHWHGMGEVHDRLHCPVCGARMDGEPKEPPVRVFFCLQCGTTYNREKQSWYGLAFHESP